MRLKSFQIENFRSINNSGPVKAARVTALLGRNESGKTNLLLALRSLKSSDGLHPLSKTKDFPRHRRLEECTDQTVAVKTTWELSEVERTELTTIFPRCKNVKEIEVGRTYAAKRWVKFTNLKPIDLSKETIANSAKKLRAALLKAAEGLEEAPQKKLEQAAAKFEEEIVAEEDPIDWGVTALKALTSFRQAVADANTRLADQADATLGDLEELAKTLAGDEEAHKKACNWIVEKLPVFIYLDEYPELPGHQNIAQYLDRKSKGDQNLTEADRNFEKLCKVAGLAPQQLQELFTQRDQETRNQLANRAGAVVTSEIRRLWKDRQLTVRFNLDAEHMDTFVSDPTATYPVEVNFDDRSRGFKWFFSFYMTFAADTKGGSAENAILLLDEPGLYLHAMSQGDLLHHLWRDFSNQIIYTTHSPFMVPTRDLDSVRTVNIGQETGTTATNDPTGDSRTLFPLQSALGYSLAQSLFVGPKNLVVEGVTDYWILSSISSYLAEAGNTKLDPELTITPGGGAQRIPYMVALLTSEQLTVLVLLDHEKQSSDTKGELVRAKLIREENVVFVTEAFENDVVQEADLEDLLDPAVYEALVRESYSGELKGKKLVLNPKIPRITKRFEAALADLGIEFHKTRPARLLLNRMAAKPADVVNSKVADRFELLFNKINTRLAKHASRGREPFR